MLYGEIVRETREVLVFRVHTTLGDAPAFDIQGEHVIKKADCRQILRRDHETDPDQVYDRLELSPSTLTRMGRSSYPLQS